MLTPPRYWKLTKIVWEHVSSVNTQFIVHVYVICMVGRSSISTRNVLASWLTCNIYGILQLWHSKSSGLGTSQGFQASDYICVEWRQDFFVCLFVYQMKNTGTRYFSPYSCSGVQTHYQSADTIKKTVSVLCQTVSTRASNEGFPMLGPFSKTFQCRRQNQLEGA